MRTQAAIERSELALVLFDASQPISDQDLKVMSQAVDAGRCIVLVFNKWDLMDEFDRQRMERLWKTEFNRVTWAQRVNLSAKTGWHTNRLANAMRGAWHHGQAHPHRQTQRVPWQDPSCPPASAAWRQAAANPVRDAGVHQTAALRDLRHRLLGACYRRYIERCLREEFGFEGSPIQISVNVREKKKRK